MALASRAEGAVLLAEGEVASGLSELERALAAWQSIEAPYEAARTRVLIAQACHRLGDDDTAELELDAADRAFRDLRASRRSVASRRCGTGRRPSRRPRSPAT